MILVDVNLLVYASVTGTPQHPRALDWLDEKLNGATRVGLPWQSLMGFLRLVTNARLYTRPLGVAQAWSQIEMWLESPTVWTPGPGERHRTVLAALVESGTVAARTVPDAHLAALAIEHGLKLVSTDRDFARFPGLRWENPIAA
jgi:toxin-antitoxin system PIN domain toxin